MAAQTWGRTACRFGCLSCYGASNVLGRRMQQLRTVVRQMSEYYPIQDDVYGLTDDQKQVTYVWAVLG